MPIAMVQISGNGKTYDKKIGIYSDKTFSDNVMTSFASMPLP